MKWPCGRSSAPSHFNDSDPQTLAVCAAQLARRRSRRGRLPLTPELDGAASCGFPTMFPFDSARANPGCVAETTWHDRGSDQVGKTVCVSEAEAQVPRRRCHVGKACAAGLGPCGSKKPQGRRPRRAGSLFAAEQNEGRHVKGGVRESKGTDIKLTNRWGLMGDVALNNVGTWGVRGVGAWFGPLATHR